MILEVDTRSVLPPYEQLRQQVTALVVGGALTAGSRLPSIRQLANDLGVAGGTVARAYRELELDGVVRSNGRHGTVVTGPPSARSGPTTSPELLLAARRFVGDAARLGAGLDEALTAVRAAYAGGGNT